MLAVIQNPIITAITNPDNLKPDVIQGSRAFFSQRQVLDKVPTALLVYAAMTLGLQTVGYLLLSPPPEKFSHSIDNEANQNSLKCGDKSNATCGKVASSQNSDPQVSEQNHKSYGSYNTNGNKDQSSVDRTLSCIAVGMANKETDCCRQDKYKAPSVKPLQALQTPIFYSVFTLKSNYYKQFALLYIRDDRYLTLTLVGTLIPVVTVVSRLFWRCLGQKGHRHQGRNGARPERQWYSLFILVLCSKREPRTPHGHYPVLGYGTQYILRHFAGSVSPKFWFNTLLHKHHPSEVKLCPCGPGGASVSDAVS